MSKTRTSTNAVSASTSTVKRKAGETKVSLKNRISNVVKAVRGRIDNTKKQVAAHRKKAKKATKTQKRLERQQKLRGIIGIWALLTVVSIGYSTHQTNLFVDGTQMVIALAPQVISAIILLLIAFYKLFK